MANMHPSSISDCLSKLEALSPYRWPKGSFLSCIADLLIRLEIGAALIVPLGAHAKTYEPEIWSTLPEPSQNLLHSLCSMPGENPLERLGTVSRLNSADMAPLFPSGFMKNYHAAALPVRCGEGLFAALCCIRPREKGDWSPEEQSCLHVIALYLGLFFAGKNACSEQEMQNRILNAAMARGKIYLYITDPRTDVILYMNESMKEVFGLQHPEGQICWKVLQTGKTERCEFCPVGHLETHPEEQAVYRWEEYSALTGRFFENYDSLMPWTDGRLVHLQQSIDVTDSKRLYEEASTDELTGLLNRRAGLARLLKQLDSLEKEQGAPLTVALLDINFLKRINDDYGHSAGDRAITLIARAAQGCLKNGNFCFRLSGDEFVLVFCETGRHEAIEYLEKVLENLKTVRRDRRIAFPLEFSFGCFEVRPGHGLNLQDILARADESMYGQKKLMHIRDARRRLEDNARGMPRTAEFDYDSNLLYDALMKSTDAYIFVSNMKTGVFRYSRAMVEEFGLPQEIVENAAAVWGEKIHPDDKQAFLEANQIITDGRADAHCVEYRALNTRGEWVWVRCRGHLKRDAEGTPSLFAGFITNLGQKNKMDHITGQYNKIKFGEDIAVTLRYRPEHPMQILVLGLDGFKSVNERYDRLFGDDVLRVIAQKIQSLLPNDATIYRLDGDEFGIIVSGGRARAETIYRAIAESFRFQQEYDGKKFFCTVSAGCAGYPEDGSGYAVLLQHASAALGESKALGRNRLTFFTSSLIEGQKRSLELLEQLRESMERDHAGFEVAYQPQVVASTGEIMGAEALARWTSPQYGPISPATFIPLLEQSGLIVPFGKWIFRQAMIRCKEWTKFHPRFVMSVNLSYLQVSSGDMVPFIRRTLEQLELNPANLVVEFTESCIIQESEKLHGIFEEIRALGIRIAMDDFGTGYSSLGMLKNSPADVVKIDRTFVRDILDSRFDATFIHFVVALCHDVGIRVCLEGVEREEELRRVRPMNLDYIQGFLFGRPVNAETFAHDFLRSPDTALTFS